MNKCLFVLKQDHTSAAVNNAEPLTNDRITELRQELSDKHELQSSAVYSSSRGWDDGVIMPQDTRKVSTGSRPLHYITMSLLIV